jgi:TolB-like protein
MKVFLRRAMMLTLGMVALVSPAGLPAQAKPVIAVMYFDNNSIGKDRADFDGIGKGLADMLVTDMASNPNVRVVERERVQALLTEQNLIKSGAVDPQTAIRLGKIIGAQYMITGGFMSDSKGRYVLTARAINVETGAITSPTRIDTRGDDVLGLMSQLSTKLNTEMKLPALQVGDAGGAPAAAPSGMPSSEKAAPQPAADARVAAAKPAENKPVTRVAASKPAAKMDMRTALLYSKALEEEDAGNKSKAVELYKQVILKFPDYAPAQQKIKKLS